MSRNTKSQSAQTTGSQKSKTSNSAKSQTKGCGNCCGCGSNKNN